MILMILKRKISVMILKVLFISRLCVYNVYDHFQRMATTINFQKKVRKKVEEVNNLKSILYKFWAIQFPTSAGELSQ